MTARTTPGDVLLFDHGDVPRGPIEESLAGDMSRTIALAQWLREQLVAVGCKLSEPDVGEEFGAVMWLGDGAASPLRSVVLEPVPGMNVTWAIRFEEHRGCVGVFFPFRPNAEAFEPIRIALDAILSTHEDQMRNGRWMTEREFRRLI